MRPRSDGTLWLLLVVAVVLLLPADPSIAARSSAAFRRTPAGDRAARVPPGLDFTNEHGCQPAADWASPQLDQRVRVLLQGVAQHNRVRVSCLHTGHSVHVKGTTRVSNHTVWRAVDLDMVDGQPVGPGNLAAHHLAMAIGQGAFGVQPSEVGSPWSFGGRPWFTDSGHQGHLHVGFGR